MNDRPFITLLLAPLLVAPLFGSSLGGQAPPCGALLAAVEKGNRLADFSVQLGVIVLVCVFVWRLFWPKYLAWREARARKLSPLMLACEAGLVDRARELLEAGADVNEQNKMGISALIIASAKANLDLVKLLLAHHATCDLRDDDGVTALMYAVQFGVGEEGDACVQALISAGAGVHLRAVNGWTLLHFALSNETLNRDHLRQFIAAGVDVNAEDSGMIQGDYVTSVLCYAALFNDTQSAQILIEAGASLEPLRQYSPSPLNIACMHGKTQMVALLLSLGANVETLNEQGSTPLILAADAGLVDEVRLLLKHGANPAHLTKKGRTALYYAKANKHEAVVLLLESLSK